ncbi:prepilin peptidase [Nocardia stercoris]|uniref:Prepilin peptidase n=1 Tax=Nocardia stercoris TaxID=2483361 RepID=A0A3M2L1N7_9NOCA|nr:A24 family peptidase [Nocardia stercoris]RMI30640.1 prepilin peptidase [Nocardia stercoris]
MTTPFAVLLAWCVPLTVIDARTRRLPDLLTLPGAAGTLGYAAGGGRLAPALAGALLLAGPYLLIHLGAPSACGAGDVKLAVGLGAAAALGGARAWLAAAIAAPILTALAATALLTRGAPRGQPVPHGPAMCGATLLALALSG